MSEHTYFGRGFSVVDEDPAPTFVDFAANSLDDLVEIDDDDDDAADDDGKGKLYIDCADVVSPGADSGGAMVV